MRPRREKLDHLVYADAVDSRSKSGVWFGEREDFKALQKTVMDAIREKCDWLPLDDAIMCVSVDVPGIAGIVTNPSLPGGIVLADGSTQENTAILQERYTKLVRGVLQDNLQSAGAEPGR